MLGGGGVNIREAQIYIKKQKQLQKVGRGVVSQLGDLYSLVGCKNITRSNLR